MTVHTEKSTAQSGGAVPPTLTRLRVRETALRQQAAQLEARAEHLERTSRMQEQRLHRRVDAHEKIVLGALVKKAGLALPLLHAELEEQRSRDVNGDDAVPLRRGIAAQSMAYDRELILGALLWLASALERPANDVVTLSEHQRLREDGRQALKRIK